MISTCSQLSGGESRLGIQSTLLLYQPGESQSCRAFKQANLTLRGNTSTTFRFVKTRQHGSFQYCLGHLCFTESPASHPSYSSPTRPTIRYHVYLLPFIRMPLRGPRADDNIACPIRLIQTVFHRRNCIFSSVIRFVALINDHYVFVFVWFK